MKQGSESLTPVYFWQVNQYSGKIHILAILFLRGKIQSIHYKNKFFSDMYADVCAGELFLFLTIKHVAYLLLSCACQL